MQKDTKTIPKVFGDDKELTELIVKKSKELINKSSNINKEQTISLSDDVNKDGSDDLLAYAKDKRSRSEVIKTNVNDFNDLETQYESKDILLILVLLIMMMMTSK